MAVYTSYEEIVRRKATSGKENEQMQYLVQMKFVPQGRPTCAANRIQKKDAESIDLANVRSTYK